MSQDCQGLGAPQGQLREAQPENTRECLFPLAPVPSSTRVRKNLISFLGLTVGNNPPLRVLGTLNTNQGPLGVPPLGSQGGGSAQ